MAKPRKRRKTRRKKFGIHSIVTTSDKLTSRAGMAPVVEYLEKEGVIGLFSGLFGDMKKSSKGCSVYSLFLQLVCFFIDGTKTSLTYFDELARTPSHSSILGVKGEDVVSSHSVKRFFRKFQVFHMRWFEKLYLRLFQWRLGVETPKVIELTVDSVVYDNDDSHKTQGVSPTYKKKKGFQPLNVLWNGMTVFSRFRRGSKHGNYGNEVVEIITKVVAAAREIIPDIQIVIKLDSGFFDEAIMSACNDLEVGCLMTGKLYQDVINEAKAIEESEWKIYEKGKAAWGYANIDYAPSSWKKETVAKVSTLYTTLLTDECGQEQLRLKRPDQVVLHNLTTSDNDVISGNGLTIEGFSSSAAIIKAQHQRGKDELVHRCTKEFGTEKMPFQRFFSNAAYYHVMVISHTLLVAYQRDIVAPVAQNLKVVNPNTLRRAAIDIAGRVVRSGRRTILKVVSHTRASPSLVERLWKKVLEHQPALQT